MLKKPDTKDDAATAQKLYKTLLNTVASEGLRLYQQYKKLEKQSLLTVSSSLVLIVGHSRGTPIPHIKQ